MLEEKNRKALINSLQNAIEEKDQQIKEFKNKLEIQKNKHEEAEKEAEKNGASPGGNNAPKYSLVKIADEINEIKQLMSGKKEIPVPAEEAAEADADIDKEVVFEEFVKMEKSESE